MPRAERADHVGARRIRTRPVRSEPRSRTGRTARRATRRCDSSGSSRAWRGSMAATRPFFRSPIATWRAAACTFTSACSIRRAATFSRPRVPQESPPLRHAIAGTLASLGDGMAICAPGPNSYRRFRPEAYVPMHPTWSINNRGSAVRVPASDPANLQARASPGRRGCESVSRHGMDPGRHSPRPHTRARTAAGHDRQRLRTIGRAAAHRLEPGHRAFRGQRIRETLLRRKVHAPLFHGEARRGAGIQLAHHAARNRALSRTAVGRRR